MDSAIIIGFPNTCPLDSDLSSGQHYPTFEQPGPGNKVKLGVYLLVRHGKYSVCISKFSRVSTFSVGVFLSQRAKRNMM